MGLIVVRAEGPRTHHHGHHHHARRAEPKHSSIDHHMGRFGRLFSFLATSVTVGGPIAALVSLISVLSSSNTAGPVNNSQESASASSPVLGGGSSRQVVFMVVYLLLSMCLLAMWCAHRFSSKGK
ncbi:hypothetical protein, partial [Candidatus Ichthyocystis sparus]